MVGPQYDLLMNPLGAVRQTFEKAVEVSQPSDLDPTALYRGKDWGIVDLLNQFLFDQGGLAQVALTFGISFYKCNPVKCSIGILA